MNLVTARDHARGEALRETGSAIDVRSKSVRADDDPERTAIAMGLVG